MDSCLRELAVVDKTTDVAQPDLSAEQIEPFGRRSSEWASS